MDCRAGCAACCIVPSISSPIPGMPQGKAAYERCVQLSADNLCLLFGSPQRPAVCSSLRASAEMCGATNDEAFERLTKIEVETRPTKPLENIQKSA